MSIFAYQPGLRSSLTWTSIKVNISSQFPCIISLAKIPRHCLWFVKNCNNREWKIFLQLKTNAAESGGLHISWFIVHLLVLCGRKWAVWSYSSPPKSFHGIALCSLLPDTSTRSLQIAFELLYQLVLQMEVVGIKSYLLAFYHCVRLAPPKNM